MLWQYRMYTNAYNLLIVTSVKLTQDDYTVNEDEGTVTICVERVGRSSESITVTVRSRELSPADAIGMSLITMTITTIGLIKCFCGWLYDCFP